MSVNDERHFLTLGETITALRQYIKNFMKIVMAYLALWVSVVLSYGDDVGSKLKVVATNSIIGDWVKEVAGVKGAPDDRVELTVLVGPDTDNHTFEPMSQDGVSLAKADIIFENGLGLEYWLDALYKSSQSKALRVPLSRQLKGLIPVGCQGHKCSHAHLSEYDPHTWLNPNYVVTMVQSITDALAKADPKNAGFYNMGGLKYIQDLKALNSWIVGQVDKIPSANRKLITNHDSFRYFARQYGFISVGDVLGSTSTEGGDPSGGRFAELKKLIHENKVPAIFGENVQSPVLINNLAQEAGLPQPKLLYTEALSKKDGPAKDYIEFMKYNVKILVESLNPHE